MDVYLGGEHGHDGAAVVGDEGAELLLGEGLAAARAALVQHKDLKRIERCRKGTSDPFKVGYGSISGLNDRATYHSVEFAALG
jgi:hypothetical protein